MHQSRGDLRGCSICSSALVLCYVGSPRLAASRSSSSTSRDATVPLPCRLPAPGLSRHRQDQLPQTKTMPVVSSPTPSGLRKGPAVSAAVSHIRCTLVQGQRASKRLSSPAASLSGVAPSLPAGSQRGSAPALARSAHTPTTPPQPSPLPQSMPPLPPPNRTRPPSPPSRTRASRTRPGASTPRTRTASG